MSCGQPHRRRLKDHPDRQRRPVPDRVAEAIAPATPGAGGRPSQLVDGRQDLGRFGDADEQGPRADRGASSVRPAVGADRHRRPPAVGDPFAGRICRRLGARPARRARHAHPDRLCARLAGADGDAGASGSTSPRSARSTSKRPISSVSRRCGSPARRSRRAARRRPSSMPPTRSRSQRFLAGAIGFLDIAATGRAKRSANATAPAPRSIADVLDIDRTTRARVESSMKASCH